MQSLAKEWKQPAVVILQENIFIFTVYLFGARGSELLEDPIKAFSL